MTDDTFNGNVLPPFPVDDATLDLLWQAIHPGPEATRSSVGDVLEMYAMLGGSDPNAVERVVAENIHIMRDQMYSEYSVITALIEEVRRLRGQPTPEGEK